MTSWCCAPPCSRDSASHGCPRAWCAAIWRAVHLVRALPAWRSPQGIVHVVFPTRRGMLPAVRAFIDFLAERLPATL